MTASVSNMTAILKTLYPQGQPLDLVYKDHPLLALLPKDEGFFGENKKIPLKFGGNAGRSSSFARALANQSNVKTSAFLITRASDYAIASISNELLEASKHDAGAFVEGFKLETDGAMTKLSASLAQALYGNGSGVIGQIDAAVTLASTTLTLRDPETIVFFEEGDVIRLSANNDGSGAVRTGSLVIEGINRVTGVITTTANISTGVAAANVNDYISIDGDYDNKVSGLGAWIPATAPGSTAFFGVDRTLDVTRLGGHRGDYSALPIEEALIRGASLIGRDGGKPSHVFMNYEQHANLISSLGSKVQYVDIESSYANIGFQGVKVNVGNGMVTVIPDQNCPSNRMHMLQMDSWKFCSLGKAPRLFNTDGNAILRTGSADSLELRCLYYGQLACMAPGWNGNFQIA